MPKSLTAEESQLRELNTEYLERYGFHDPEHFYTMKADKGLNEDVVRWISAIKQEPEWMTEFRVKSYREFMRKGMPTWGADLSGINFDDIRYFVRATNKQSTDWDDVPEEIKRTFDRLGIPEAERKFLSGVGAQYECLAGETRVYTSRGLVPIAEVEVGDTVFAYDEETEELIPAPVKATMAKGVRQVYKMTVGTRTIRATDNHPFLTLSYERKEGKQRGRYRREWKYLHELRPGNLVAVAKALPVESAVAELATAQVSGNTWVVDAYHQSFASTIELDDNDYLGFVRIESIEADGMAEVYDIEVDGPHNFVAEGLIVHNSEVVYHKVREDLERKGVMFLDMDSGLREHPEIVKEYFGTVIPYTDNKFAALNSAVWSGGSFVYVPPGVHVEMPLQAYFRINTENMGQFERTLIIVDEGAFVHYVEGCTAPVYSTASLHSAVVEIIVKKGGRARYTTIQNWAGNIYNLVTKRAVAYQDATMEWVDANIGSKVTMKYPAVYLMEPGAHGEVLSIAFAGDGQHQDTGGKIVHVAPKTTSKIVSKSISKGTGRSSYRGLLKVYPGATDVRSNVVCDALLLDTSSRSDTYPYIEIEEDDVTVGHEASVSKVGEEQLFYLMSRGLSEDEANAMIVNGFIEPLAKELPIEFSVELRRLIEIELEGSVG